MVSANPTGPIVVSAARNGAIGDSLARLLEFGGHEVEREYYYNDAGAQMDRFRESVEAIRRGEDPPEDGYQGDYVRELAKLPGDPVPPMLEQIEQTLERFRIHFDSWALQSELATAAAGDAAAARHVRAGRCRLGALVRVRRRAGPRDPPLRDARADLPGRRHRLPRRTSSTAASTARSTCSAPTTTAPATGTRRSRGCSATTRSGSRCCSTSSSI